MQKANYIELYGAIFTLHPSFFLYPFCIMHLIAKKELQA